MGSSSVKVLFAGRRNAQKSFETAIALARALARRGRAIVVAADAGDESFDVLLSEEGGARPPGFSDVAAGAATCAETIHRDVDSRLHVISGGRAESDREQDVRPALDALAQTYDFVVVATWSRDRALFLAPSFDVALVSGDDAHAEAFRDEIERAGAAGAFVVENGSGSADDLFAA